MCAALVMQPPLLQILLKEERGQKELERWPQYQGRLVPDAGQQRTVHLNTLQYFLFWTAFYVLRSNQSSGDSAASSRRPVNAFPTYGSLRKVLICSLT